MHFNPYGGWSQQPSGGSNKPPRSRSGVPPPYSSTRAAQTPFRKSSNVADLHSSELEHLERYCEKRLLSNTWKVEMQEWVRDRVTERLSEGKPIIEDELVEELMPIARSRVPPEIVNDVLGRILLHTRGNS